LGAWSENYWADREKVCFFLRSNFYVSDSFKFQCDPFSNKKDVSQMAYFIFGYFSTKLALSEWRSGKINVRN
jgi:hypothetical protein